MKIEGANAATPVLPSADDRRPRRIGFAILVAAFGGFGTWAATAPLESAVVAPGVVMVSNYRKTVQHLEGGIVRDIRVREGDRVAAGDVLIVLDKTLPNTELGALRGQIEASEALKARLLAERDGAMTFAVDAATVEADTRRSEAWEGERRIFESRRQLRRSEVRLLEATIEQLEHQIIGYRQLSESRANVLASYREEIADLSALLADGYVDKQRLREQERMAARLEAEIVEYKDKMLQARLRIAEVRQQMQQQENRFLTEVAAQLADVQGRLYVMRERMLALEDRVDRTVIRSPHSGVVIGMNAHSLGGVVGAGAPILDVVPDDEELIVEAEISPLDIDRVATGAKVDIRFSAFQSASTTTVEGELRKVSADRLVKKDSGKPYYLAQVKLGANAASVLDDMSLVPGMPAEVFIRTGARTMLNYVLKPIENAIARSLNED